MARAVSRVFAGNVSDALAGTTVGVLPVDAPGYDVEVQLSTNSASRSGRATLLVDGVAIMQDSLIPQYDNMLQEVSQDSGTPSKVAVFSGHMSPRGDAPTVFFRARAGARLTLNLTGQAADDATNVYVNALPATAAPLALNLVHIGTLDANSTNTSHLNILSGTVVGQIPTSANLWNIAIQAAIVLRRLADAPGSQGANVTLLVDEDTVCENFVLPRRTQMNWPVDERDTLINALVTGGSSLTLNVNSAPAVMNADIIYKVFASPVA